jgi:hypothetical protein
VAAAWDEVDLADVAPAEVVISANVTYGVQQIEPFVRRMDAVATRTAALIATIDPPMAPMAPFWKAIYGDERLRLPCSAELIDVLIELGAKPEVTPLPALPAQPLGTRDEALAELRRRLFVAPGTENDERLQRSVSELATERDGLFWSPAARPRHRNLIRWTPGSMR